jgi:DNA-binding transcriptional regulator/RsmH inhibitor MraZ
MAKVEAGQPNSVDAKSKAPEKGSALKDAKEQQPVSKEESGGKRKIKNQQEIDRVKKQNAEIQQNNERKEREIAQRRAAVDAALELVSARLGQKGLTEKDRARLEWVQKSVKEAGEKLNNGKYEVKVEKNGQGLASREEPVMVDGLLRVALRQVDSYTKRAGEIKQTQELKNRQEEDSARLAIGNLDQVIKKREWTQAFKKLPDGKLKAKILKKVEEWQAKDGKEYSAEELEHQMGEAAFQAVSDYTKNQMEAMRKNGKEMEDLARELQSTIKILENSGLDYFKYHYGKDSSQLTQEERRTQHLYTEREANLIAIDAGYRQMLLEDYKDQLPKNFEQLNVKDQNYNLAMLALEHRLLFTLPQKEKLLDVPEAEYEEELEIAGNPVSPDVGSSTGDKKPEKHILVNTNEPYDIENQAFGPGKLSQEASKAIEKPGKIFLIDMSEIAKRMAWTQTEERIRKEYSEMGRVMRALNGLTENKRRIEYYQANLQAIQNDNNLMRAISERVSGRPIPGQRPKVSNEYLELLDKTVAEYKNDVVDTQREVGDSLKDDSEVKLKFAELLHRFRTDKWEGDAYKGLDKRAAVELFVKENIAGYINKQTSAKWSTDIDRIKEAKGLLYASNFYEICESVSQNYDQQIESAVKEVMKKNPEANIEAIKQAISLQVEGVQGLELQLGLRDRDVINNRPKGILNFYERMVSWSEGAKVDAETGSMSMLSKPKRVIGKILLNPFVLGASSAVASQGVQRLVKWGAVGGAVALGASGFWVPLGIGAAVGGAARAFKRSKDIKYDQAQELRHETLGGGASKVLGEKAEMGYGAAVMSFKEALEQVKSLQGKKDLSQEEKEKLAAIVARLELERDALADTKKQFTKVDLFKLEKDQGEAFGSTAAAKSDLRVAIKQLNLPPELLQTLVNKEKGKILDIINKSNSEQDSFRRKEMLKAGVYGALMGIAGGTLGQQVGYEAGRGLEKLLGGDYFHTHGTFIEKMTGRTQGFFDNAGTEHLSAPSVVSSVAPGRSRTAIEWLHELKGKISGGNVEKIHTEDWYDNPTGEAGPHMHNSNELKFYISKDTAGNFHFKVPVEEDGSWRVKGGWAEVNKAFADSRIKMIFVPDGKNPAEGIVLDVDAKTHEIIIPKGSNLAELFDPATGRPKGTGFFGLAERVWVNNKTGEIYTDAKGGYGNPSPDLMKNFHNEEIWINSERNNGAEIKFGNADEIKTKIIPGKITRGDVSDYDQTVPTVPLTRKYFDRPEETSAKAEKKKQKEEEKKQKAKAKEEEKARKQEEKLAKVKEKKEKHSTSEHHEHKGGSEKTVVKETSEGQKEVKEFLTKHEKNIDEMTSLLGNEVLPEDKIIYETYAIFQKLIADGKNIKHKEEAEVAINKAFLERFKKLSGSQQDKVVEHYEKLSEYVKKKEEPPKPKEVKEKIKGLDVIPKGTFDADSKDAKKVVKNEKQDFGALKQSLIEKTNNGVHFDMDGELVNDDDKVEVLKTLDKALEDLPENTRKGILRKLNRSQKGNKSERGLIVGFPTNASKLEFDSKDRLVIPPNTDSKKLKDFLESYYEEVRQRVRTRKRKHPGRAP